MNYVLIIFITFHIDGGTHSQTIGFESEQRCSIAKLQVESDFNATERKAGYRSIFSSCVRRER